MAAIVVIGSGASGVHFALSLLRKGLQVTMLDVGYAGQPPPLPAASLNQLKEELADPVDYFLGARYQGAILPSWASEFYGLPPSKDFVLEAPDSFAPRARGFAPLFSFARGGFSEAWTAGCYPFDDDDLQEFPFSCADLERYYAEVASRIGITGLDDDLSRFFPAADNLLPPIDLDENSRVLCEQYARRRSQLNGSQGFYLGRTRVATLSRDLGSRHACNNLGRCLWGCPTGSLYTSAQTLEECLRYPNFSYRPRLRVSHFQVDSRNRVTSVVARSTESGEELTVPADSLALAAGTLNSSEIVLRSILEHTGEVVRLPGLMDNPQILVPFVNLRMIGKQFSARTYQYHLLGLAMPGRTSADYVHGQITTFKTGMIHPVAQGLPLDMRTATYITRNLHAALGVVNLNLSDSRREDNFLTLDRSAPGHEPKLTIEYRSAMREPADVQSVAARAKKALWKLGCIVPRDMTHVRPMGASVHYAGTLPMTTRAAPWTTDENCRSRDFENLFVVDGSTFPALPAKNLTFTLMANAVRVADKAF